MMVLAPEAQHRLTRIGQGSSRLAVVTASTDLRRSAVCLNSWRELAVDQHFPCLIVENGDGRPYLGTVPAFRRGIDELLATTEVEVICAFHDDVQIYEHGWDARVLRLFDEHPACGLAGFGGAAGLGSANLYTTPYDPMHLARIGFRSNMVEAETHGIRSLLTQRVACLDGFSQIGRRAFWEGFSCREQKTRPYLDAMTQSLAAEFGGVAAPTFTLEANRPWTYLEDLGVIHHFYDGMLGCLAARYGWETWYLPISCQHYGGQTAVGDAGYQDWAKTKTEGGDHGFWEAAHKIGYEAFRDVLPLRV